MTAAATTRYPARPALLWALQGLLAVIFVAVAIPKLTADPAAVAGFTTMGLGVAGMYVIGVLEVAGAVAVLVPRLAGLAATCQVALMIGAVVLVGVTMSPVLAVMPAAVGVLAGTVAWSRRDSIAELLVLCSVAVR